MNDMTSRFTLILRLAASAAALSLLAACSGDGVSERPDLLHRVHAQEAPQMLYLPIAAPHSREDSHRLELFGRQYMASGNGPVTIAYPANMQADDAVIATATALRDMGVPSEKILRGPYEPAENARPDLVVSFTSLAAVGSGCPKEWGDPTRDSGNGSPLRFGCTVQQNFAAMIDRPKDLLEPRTSTPADAERRQTVVEKYRAGERTAAERELSQTDTRIQE
ncbi:MAG: CpaD family pilus assembly protein [Neomegalonema sp.]|nr:CpaD family pilus assembly protein [Neomegalonema sp.]